MTSVIEQEKLAKQKAEEAAIEEAKAKAKAENKDGQ